MLGRLISFAAIVGAVAGQSLQQRWDRHFEAFGAQDLEKILLDYADDAVIEVANWQDGSKETYEGPGGVIMCFSLLFAQMSDLSDLAAPVIQVDEVRGTVFLIWKNPASGIVYGTDTFYTNKEGLFVRQHVVMLNNDGNSQSVVVAPNPSNDHLPTQKSWQHHFAAFGAKDVDEIVKDYAEDAIIHVYNQLDGQYDIYNYGHQGVRDCFIKLFGQLFDYSDLAAPIQVVEEATQEHPGRVLLTWSNSASGFLKATDTFISNEQGKFVQQNVVVIYAGMASNATVV